MAKTSVHSFQLENLTPDEALALLSSAEFEIRQTAGQDGNQSCKVVEKSRDENTLVYELQTVEYAKGITGIDRTSTINTTTLVTWDLKRRSSRWEYSGPHGKRAKVSGGTQITAAGDGSHVRTQLDVEIKVPLIGRKIEDMVIKGTEKHWPTYEKLVRAGL